MQPLSPLILECVRPAPDRVSELIVQVTDWEAVVTQAEAHGVAPLLHWHLQRAHASAIPQAAAQRLSQRFYRNANRNLRFGAELLRLVSTLEAAGIEVLAFKGPAIAWSLYETPALREMSDLDLLVRPPDARRAFDLLLSQGCGPTYPGADWRLFRWLSEISLVRGEVPVDLHWATLPTWLQSAGSDDAVWTRSRRIQVAGGAVRTFSPEDLLLFLSVHGGKHCWTSLNWLADLARLVAVPAIDWDGVLARAHASRISRTLFLSLILIRDLLGASLPPEVSARIDADPIAIHLANRVIHERRAGSNWPGSQMQRLTFTTALAETISVKARAVWSQAQPTLAEDTWLRLPYIFYYLTRPIRLLVKYVC